MSVAQDIADEAWVRSQYAWMRELWSRTNRIGDARGLGEQPSITDRDLGDESRVIVVDARMPWQKQIDAQSADIATLETEVQRLHQAHEQYVDAQRILTKNACDWRDAEIAKLRADLDRLMATPPAPSTSPTPPPHNHMANALAHSEPKQPWLR